MSSATCWAASPEHTNLPSMAQPAQAPGQAASAAPALHRRCAHRGAHGAQPPAAEGSSRAKDLESKAGRPILPHLHGFALFYSCFPTSWSLPPTASCKVAGNLISPWRSTITACCSRRSTLIPPQELSRFLTGTGSPPGCPYFLTRISPPRSAAAATQLQRVTLGQLGVMFLLLLTPVSSLRAQASRVAMAQSISRHTAEPAFSFSDLQSSNWAVLLLAQWGCEQKENLFSK